VQRAFDALDQPSCAVSPVPWTPDLLNAIDHLKTRLRQPPPSVSIQPAIHPGL
jgi:hypothetical protein